MKEIIELNRQLRGHSRGCFSAGVLVVRRNDQRNELKRLPASVQMRIEEIRGKINKIVPDDFSYIICLGQGAPVFMLEYWNGSQTQFVRSHDWLLNQPLINQLKNLNWDAERAQAIASGQTFDGMPTATTKTPLRLPSTKALQARFRAEMKEFVENKREDVRKVHVMLWHDDEGAVGKTFDSLKDFVHQLPDIMTVKYWIITIVADGRPFAADKIEMLKKRALKELEEMPISYALATGNL